MRITKKQLEELASKVGLRIRNTYGCKDLQVLHEGVTEENRRWSDFKYIGTAKECYAFILGYKDAKEGK